MTPISQTARNQAQDLLDFIDASPSPWHAVATCEQRLQAAGFARLDETERWTLQAGDKRYVVRGDAAIIAFVVGSAALAESGLRIIGAHTDSPGLRIKPRPAEEVGGMVRLGVEVYGGPISLPSPIVTCRWPGASMCARPTVSRRDWCALPTRCSACPTWPST